MVKQKRILKEGDIFGYWTVLSFRKTAVYPHSGAKRDYYTCRCRCGTVREVQKYQLIYGLSKSCGCIKNEANGRKVKLYTVGKHSYSMNELASISGVSYNKFYCRVYQYVRRTRIVNAELAFLTEAQAIKLVMFDFGFSFDEEKGFYK